MDSCYKSRRFQPCRYMTVLARIVVQSHTITTKAPTVLSPSKNVSITIGTITIVSAVSTACLNLCINFHSADTSASTNVYQSNSISNKFLPKVSTVPPPPSNTRLPYSSILHFSHTTRHLAHTQRSQPDATQALKDLEPRTTGPNLHTGIRS